MTTASLADSHGTADLPDLAALALEDVHRTLDRDGRVRCRLMGGVDPARRPLSLSAPWGRRPVDAPPRPGASGACGTIGA